MAYIRRNVSTSLSPGEFDEFSIRASERGHEAFAPYLRALILREGVAWKDLKKDLTRDKAGDEKRQITAILNRYARILDAKNEAKK